MNSEIKVGQRFKKTGGDYEFEGEVVAIFRKRVRNGMAAGPVRVVGEDDRGLLFIFDPNRIELIWKR